jgi:hypothetical protein
MCPARALKLLFHVTDDLDITLMAHDELTQGKGFNFVYAYITPGNSILLGPPRGAAISVAGGAVARHQAVVE